MGESKRKKTTTEKFIKKHPYCCFCGGGVASETIDHFPSRELFRKRDRPNSLLFPACWSCNNSSSDAETLVAWLTKAATKPKEQCDLDEMGKLISPLFRRNPGLFEELNVKRMSRAFEKLHTPNSFHGGAEVYVGGDILNKYIDEYAIKLAKALHYEFSKNIVGDDFEIRTRWFPNYDLFNERIPSVFLQGFKGEPKTLTQGKKHVKDQFLYNGMLNEDKTQGVYKAVFRESFMIMTSVKIKD